MNLIGKIITGITILIAVNPMLLIAQSEDPYLFKLDSFNKTLRESSTGYIPHTSEHFAIYSEYNSQSGDYRGFIEPRTNINAILGFKGYKRIDTNQSFSGEFKVFKNIRENWNWVFVRDYQGFSPVLLGDSTSGRARFNGIQMSGKYSYHFNSTDEVSAALAYLVDEGLKQLTPRPVSEHRDIRFEVSGSYGLFNRFILNGGLLIGDLNETINYKEDQGGLTQETILLKFSGLDLPSVIRKKTETRFQYINLYSSDAGINYLFNEQIEAGLIYSGEVVKRIQKDDALDPRLAGYIRGISDDIKMNVNIRPDGAGETEILAGYNHELWWSRAAGMNVLYSKAENEKFYSGLFHHFQLSDDISIFPALIFEKNNFTFSDHYSGIFAKREYYRYGVTLGGYYRASAELEFGGSLYYSADLSGSDKINYSGVMSDYLTYRIKDLYRLVTDITMFGLTFESKIKIGRHDYIIPKSGYTGILPDKKYFPGGNSDFFINLNYSLGL